MAPVRKSLPARRTSTRLSSGTATPTKSTPASAPRKLTRSRSSIIPDSDGPDLEDLTKRRVEVADSDEEDEIATSQTTATRRLLDKVVISAPKSRMAEKDSSVSSVVSAGASTRDASSEYETPLTSAAVTPAESGNEKRLGARNIATNGKRKRGRPSYTNPISSGTVAETAGDEDLARALQEQEYDSDVVKLVKKSRVTTTTRKKTVLKIADSEDEAGDIDDNVSELSELSSEMSEASFAPMPSSRQKARAAMNRQRGTGLGIAGPSASVVTPRLARAANRLPSLPSRPTVPEKEDDELSALSALPSDFEDESFASGMDATIDDSEDDDEEEVEAANRDPEARTPRQRRGRRSNGDSENWQARKARARKERERRRLEQAHPAIKTMWDDLAATPTIKPVQAEQPESINRKLKSFQLEGLDWMVRQEKTHYKGGLLGDEMGMGKTIQAVSLIMSDYPAKEPTLVVVPPVALMQWSNEIAEYTDGKLKVIVYHGQNQKIRQLSVKELKKYDVIMVSYNGLESLYRKQEKGFNRKENIVKEDSPLHAIHFHRLILDEAHSIKQRTTGVAKACFALKGTYKWCLSGTPVQNRIGEFFSLLRFLEVRPFADYFCKECSCSQLHWSADITTHRCTVCNHSSIQHVSVFNQEILNPITQRGDNELRRQAMAKLHLITDRIMLRRLKRNHTASMELPPKEIIIHNEFFGEIERDFSGSIMGSSTRQFDTYVARGVMLNNYANIFGLIMQMRQVANHPDLILRKHAEGGQNVLVCNICDEPAEEAIRSRCKHEFCRACARNYVKSCDETGGEPDCPRCHIPLSIDWDQPDIEQDEELVKKNSIINRIKMENWTSSTKIEMLVYDLYKLRSKKQTLKSIVFSQFTSMLQLIEWRLRRAGFNTVMLDGSMTPVQRQRSIEYFMNNSDVEVFLVSLKAGGVALNLTEASRVFIVDPWWNPAAEWQSADRCHRIGQKRPCVITRLVIEDSVESRIVMLQEKKANMINGTINRDQVAMDKLTPEDLQFLFRGS